MTSTHGRGRKISPSGLSRRPARFAPGTPPKGAPWDGPLGPAGGFDEALEATALEDAPFEDAPFEDAPFEDAPFEDAPFEDSPFDASPMGRLGLEATVLDDSPLGPTELESTVLDDSRLGTELESTVLDDSRPKRPERAAASERIRPASPVRAQGTPRPQLIGVSPQGPCPPAPARMPSATPPRAFAPVPAAVALPLLPDDPLDDLPPPRKPASPTMPMRAQWPALAEVRPRLLPAPEPASAAARPRSLPAPPPPPAGAPPRLHRAPLLPAPASRALALPASFTGEMPTIPERLWGGGPSLFDGTTLGKTPFPDVLPPGLIEEDAPLDRDPDERGMLAAIAAGDETSRLIYADWLEDQDEHARAGYLRIEQLVSRLAPDDPRYAACTRQLRELAQHVDADWRARVARPPIEGCAAADARCPRRWDALARTDREAVRRCGPCGKQVHYFETVDEARDAAQRGACVAIDLGAERWENDLVDLGTRCDGCARRVVSTARYCPHCGASARRSEELEVPVINVDD